MGTISDKLTYLNTTKSQLKDMINYGLDEENKITSSTTFRNYVSSIFNAFLEALRTPDTLFTNLPKKSGTGANITLNDTANAPMRIELGASELTQDATPTPSSPQAVHTISGSNKIVVCGKNLISTNLEDLEQGTISGSNGEDTTANNRVRNNKFFVFDYDEIQPSYVWKVPNGYKNALRVYDKDKNFLGIITFSGFIDSLPQAYVGLGVKYVKLVYAKNDDSNITPNDIANLEFMISKGSTPTTYEPYTSQEADIDLVNPNNLIGLTTERCPVDLKAGDKLTIGNLTSTQIVLNCYTNRGDTTRNDYWTMQTSQKVRTITLAYDTKEIAWTTTPDNIIWINKGETLLPYEEYYNIEYCKIGNYEDKFIRNSGKNLCPNTLVSQTFRGLTFTHNEDGSITINGTSTNSGQVNICNAGEMPLIAGTYTISSTNTIPNYTWLTLRDSNSDISSMTNLSQKQITLSVDKPTAYIYFYFNNGITINNLTIYPMLEKSNSATPYEPYGSNEWYIKKNIGKVVLDGTENWLKTSDTSASVFALNNVINTASYGRGGMGYNTHFAYAFSNTAGKFYFGNGNNIAICMETTYTLETFKTWLSNNNTTVYYVLSTPTYTQITGTLAEQLENVYQKLLSYTGQTNISQVNNDLSFNLSVSALENLEV